jgi:methylenetetrahydrofolate reductase (NADPH)
MSVTEILPGIDRAGSSGIRVSFEFFPPKTDKMELQLWEAIDRLAPLHPSFVSVTYGAGGSTRSRTHSIVTQVQDRTGIPAAAHLTCVGASREEIDEIAESYWNAGIRHVVALRGDPPGGFGGAYEPQANGYAYAADLVAGLKRLHDFEISVAAYPECHPQALGPDHDIENLKRKLDAGATRAITQFFFDIDRYRRFRDKAAAAGITVPIVPGILPVLNFARTREIAASCGASLPDWFASQFENLDEDQVTRTSVATAIAVDLCRALYADGEREFHFYTLNRAELTFGICHMLGVRAGSAN